MRRYNRPRTVKGRIATVTANAFRADAFMKATEPLEREGYAVSVVSDQSRMLSGRTETGEEVNLVPVSTVGDMEFSDYCALMLPGNASDIAESASAAAEKFFKDGKPIIALANDVPLLARAANRPDLNNAQVVISMGGQIFAANDLSAADEAVSVFAQAIAA